MVKNKGEDEMPDKLLIINPGHAPGIDSGAVGPTGLRECDVVRRVVIRVERQFHAAGIGVVIVEQTKGPKAGGLKEITDKSNALDPALFISIHCNSYDPAKIKPGQSLPRGLEVYHRKNHGGETKSNRLARCLFKGIARELENATRQPGMASANFWALGKSTAGAAALVELDFIKNHAVEVLMRTDTWLDKAAAGIIAGLNLYLGIK